MKKTDILYIEANSGISGDMFVAALLDLCMRNPEVLSDAENGAVDPAAYLKEVLGTIPVQGFETVVSHKERAGIDVCDFDVVLDHEHENHDHDMDYLYGHEQGEVPQEEHEHHHEHHHHEEHEDHDHDLHHEHDHHHRNLADIRDILARTEMSEGARTTADRIFETLAKAEAKAHGVLVDEVHFHEVGSVDSIVDIVAAAVCLDLLAPERVVISPLTEGHGTVRTQHGILPVPVPAVANIVADSGLLLRQGTIRGELVTPTGAAIVAAIRNEERLPDTYCLCGIGIGGGKRDYDPPSMVRAMWIEDASSETGFSEPAGEGADSQDETKDRICRMETDIDDCTGEDLGYVMERLYEAGAREVHFTPIFMKKNRPAYELVVITTSDLVEKLEGIIFKETTTIGIRRQWMERTVLPRKNVEVDTLFGPVQMKEVTLPDGEVRRYPEYDSVKAMAEKRGISIRQLRDEL